jgi:hypothetical protein
MDHQKHLLRRLGTYHYLLGFFVAFLGCFPVLYIVSSTLILTHQVEISGVRSGSASNQIAMVALTLSFGVLVGIWTLSLLMMRAGKFLKTQQHFAFCWRLAFIECAVFPFGTLLGWQTLHHLKEKRIQQLFPDAPLPSPAEVRATASPAASADASESTEKTSREKAPETDVPEPETVV